MTNGIQPYIDVAARLWNDEVGQRRKAFSKELQRIFEEFVRRGLSSSSLLDGRLREHAAEELRARGRLAVQQFETVLGDAPISWSEEEQRAVAATAKAWLSGQANELAQSVAGAFVTGDRSRTRPEFAQLGLHEVEGRVDADIARVFQQHANRAAASGQTVNITAHIVGAIQTGAGASATITQSPTEAQRAELRAALDAITAALASFDDNALVQRAEVTELVANVRAEADRPQPRHLMLATYAGGLATAIQTLGAAPAAHQLLKGALLHFGITIP